MMENQIARIESALNRFVPETNELYKTVTDAMRYSLLNGGKRVRAVLTLEFCKLCGGTEEMAMPFACAVEMIHAYSLIHDDLPCMDNDDMRRGKPSNHKVFGENYALLAGDGLLTKAFETALSAEAFRVAGVERAAKAASVLAACAGEFGMVGGQCIDLETENQAVSLDVLYAKDTGKTANLIMAACMMGCIAAGAEDKLVEAARNYALHIGLAFQNSARISASTHRTTAAPMYPCWGSKKLSRWWIRTRTRRWKLWLFSPEIPYSCAILPCSLLIVPNDPNTHLYCTRRTKRRGRSHLHP